MERKSLKIPKGYYESVIWRRPDNAMAKRKRTNNDLENTTQKTEYRSRTFMNVRVFNINNTTHGSGTVYSPEHEFTRVLWSWYCLIFRFLYSALWIIVYLIYSWPLYFLSFDYGFWFVYLIYSWPLYFLSFDYGFWLPIWSLISSIFSWRYYELLVAFQHS